MRTGTINCGKCPVAVCVDRVKFRGPVRQVTRDRAPFGQIVRYKCDHGLARVWSPVEDHLCPKTCTCPPNNTRENSAERRGNGGGGGKQARTSKRLNGEHMTPPSPVWGGPTGKRRHEIIIDEASVLTKLTCAGS